MIKAYEPRHIVLAIAISLFVLSPVILLILPTAVIGALYYSQSQLVLYVMSKSYLVYGAALLFFVLSVFVIFLLWGRKSVVFVCFACLVLSGISFFIAAQHYILIGADKLAYRLLFSSEEHIYQWDEIEKAIYYEDEYENIASTYEFIFHDGGSVSLPENEYLKEYKFVISNLLRDENIEIEEKFYK